jgi:nucleotide-binding universal stress UspA family protein
MAMHRILLPMDASTAAVRAIPWADALGKALDAEVIMARAVDWTAETPSHDVDDHLLESMTHARAELEEAASRFHFVRPRLEVIRGTDEEIVDLARHERASLIVMATHGRTGPERTLVGSVGGRLVADSGLPVLSIGPEVVEATAAVPQSILLPYDGTELARTIFPIVGEFAAPLSARVLLFRALDPVETIPIQGAVIPIENPFDPPSRHLIEDMDVAAEDLRRAGLSVEVTAGVGSPATAILDAVPSEGVDLIAMTTHSRQGLAHWLLGSVAETVVAQSPVPVLLFHPTRTEPARRSA